VIANDNQSVGASYVNRAEPGTVTGRHILVQSLDGIRSGQLTVLLVHVVRARARVVSDPDAKVLDPQGILLWDLGRFILAVASSFSLRPGVYHIPH
jgi:hypothetical protein